MKRSIANLLSSSLMVVFSCQENDLGSGLNTVEREFTRPATDVWAAALKSAEKAELKILSDANDPMGGELLARRAGGSRVRIAVKSLAERSTRVSVRVEPGDKALAILIQEGIADQLGLGQAKGDDFGGNSLGGCYSASLEACIDTAHRVFGALKVTRIDAEIHASWARIDGRLKDSTPIRIKLEKGQDQQIHARFISGNAATDDNKAFAQKMKDEFDVLVRESKPDRLQDPD